MQTKPKIKSIQIFFFFEFEKKKKKKKDWMGSGQRVGRIAGQRSG
jgi:hypothetical protein